ncbi:MAG: ATP-binding cassette domain-containing protein [candidate division Zixibacteria bacterium]|nr:ATP-binding cassette domain-containing protein [candidate division Zixibacteria bacterium]
MTGGSMENMIEARGLCKYYGSFVAIEDISFAIPKGQIVAFLGPNGAGKSTTMKILSGFMAPSSGAAFLAGLNVGADRLEAARKLGYLPENGPLYDNMTPLEMLRFLGEARGIEGSALKRRIDEVNEVCALEQVLEKPIGKLSRGYRQRVGLAQALLHDPEVLIMDEPTAGLDPNQIHDFRNNIRRLGKSKTVLLSTHILQEVQAVAERVLVVHNGRLVFDGTPDELCGGSTMEDSFYRLTGQHTLGADGGEEVSA